MSTTPIVNSKNILNSDVEIKGTLKFAGELTFDGKLEGDITSDGTLNLSDNAVIKGNLDVSSVVLRGKINGNVTAEFKQVALDTILAMVSAPPFQRLGIGAIINIP